MPRQQGYGGDRWLRNRSVSQRGGGQGASNVTGSHTLRPVRYNRLVARIGYHDWNQQQVRHLDEKVWQTMCPLCSEVRTNTAASRSRHDLTTGICTATKACAERRKELDDETIEFLGLIPRGKEPGNERKD